MVDLALEIKLATEALLQGSVVAFYSPFGRVVAAHSAREMAVAQMLTAQTDAPRFLALAEARDVFQYVAAPDPDIVSILQSLSPNEALLFADPLGFPHQALASDGSLAILVVRDFFTKSLIKRVGAPLLIAVGIAGEDFAYNSDEASASPWNLVVRTLPR